MASQRRKDENSHASTRRSLLKATAFGAAAFSMADFSKAGDPNPLENSRIDEMIRENKSISRARQICLDILKPTPKQLEHGLKLHSESLVFDGYAFSPRAANDPMLLAKMIEEGASDIELQDVTEDMGMTRAVSDLRERENNDGFSSLGGYLYLSERGRRVPASPAFGQKTCPFYFPHRHVEIFSFQGCHSIGY